MTTVCMVVHAEGPGDLGAPIREVPPGESIMPEEQGPIHILIRRILQTGAQLPEQAIDFREPLRTQTGVRAYGSKLLSPQILDEILMGWLLREPLLVVLLVDSDSSSPNQRKTSLIQALDRNQLNGAVGVAVKEFESWLIADPSAIQKVLGAGHSPPSQPETLPPGQAKKLLTDWSKSVPNRYSLDLRKELASLMDLGKVAQQCPSFEEFQSDLLDLPFV